VGHIISLHDCTERLEVDLHHICSLSIKLQVSNIDANLESEFKFMIAEIGNLFPNLGRYFCNGTSRQF
jgi:hypothetical protein